MKKRILLTLLLVACRPSSPHHVIDPVYDCTKVTVAQKWDMSTLLDECESWECDQRVMRLYCEEIPIPKE